MIWLSIGLLVILGLALLIIEILFIPGIGIIGFIGVGLEIFSVYLLNTRLDSTYFTVFVLLLIVVNFLTIYWAFNSTLWKRFSLETTFDKSLDKINLSIGQIGITKSVIRPMGNADFEGITYEVTSDGNFIEKGVDIKIVSIVNRKIIVKPLIS